MSTTRTTMHANLVIRQVTHSRLEDKNCWRRALTVREPHVQVGDTVSLLTTSMFGTASLSLSASSSSSGSSLLDAGPMVERGHDGPHRGVGCALNTDAAHRPPPPRTTHRPPAARPFHCHHRLFLLFYNRKNSPREILIQKLYVML